MTHMITIAGAGELVGRGVCRGLPNDIPQPVRDRNAIVVGGVGMTRRDFQKTTPAALAAVGRMATVTRLAAQAPTSGHRAADVVVFPYDRMTALDAIGPYEVLRCVPGVRVRFVAKAAGLVRPDSGLQMLNAEHGIGDVTSADILLVPGGDANGPIQDPHPPLDSGSTAKASTATIDRARQMLRDMYAPTRSGAVR